MLGAEVLHFALREVRVALDLVDRRHHRCAFEEPREVLGDEVADPDRADLALSEQRLQGTVGIEGPVERRRQRLGGVWKTPSPSAGISTPLLRVSVSMSGPSR